MSASIRTTGLDGVLAEVRRGKLQRELVQMLHKSGNELARDIRGEAFTRVQRRAASTVRVDTTNTGVEVSGGTGGGLGRTLFPGAEFGGRATKKRHVRVPVYGSRPVWIRKRTTMMFAPHLGKHGYFFWPTVRTWLPEVRKDTTAVIEDTVTRRR